MLSWNIRGVFKKANRDNLRKLLVSSQLAVVCLQETKKESSDVRERNYIGAWDPVCWVEIPSDGLSGGLVTFWDGGIITVDAATGDKNWLAIIGKVLSTDQAFVCVNVYGPQLSIDTRRLWTIFKDFILMHEDKAISLVGDFNCVRNLEERKNCIYQNSDTNSFNDFIEATELFEVHMVGSGFTWCGPNAKLSKLDRVLANWELYSKGN